MLRPAAFALLALSACSSSSSVDRSSLTTSVCVSGGWSPLKGVVPAAPTTYVALAELYDGQRRTVGELGTPCTSAPDATACAAAVTAARPSTGWTHQECGGAGCHTRTTFFVTEHDGVVAVVDRIEALRTMIAPIDGAADAVLLAAFTYDAAPDCSAAQARAIGGGAWEVLVVRGDGTCTDRSEYLARVGSDGTTSTVESTFASAKQQCISP